MSDTKLRSASPCQHSSTRPGPDIMPTPDLLGQAIALSRVCPCDLSQLTFSKGRQHATVIIAPHLRCAASLRMSNRDDSELCLKVLADAHRNSGYPSFCHCEIGSQARHSIVDIIRYCNYFRVYGKLAGRIQPSLIAWQLVFSANSTNKLRLSTELPLIPYFDKVQTDQIPPQSHNE